MSVSENKNNTAKSYLPRHLTMLVQKNHLQNGNFPTSWGSPKRQNSTQTSAQMTCRLLRAMLPGQISTQKRHGMDRICQGHLPSLHRAMEELVDGVSIALQEEEMLRRGRNGTSTAESRELLWDFWDDPSRL